MHERGPQNPRLQRALADARTSYNVGEKQEKFMYFNRKTLGRGLTTPGEDGATYLDFLPTFHGQNVIELIDAKVAERKAIGGPPVRVADIGYGVGGALLEGARRWGPSVELVGIGPDVYVQHRPVLRRLARLARHPMRVDELNQAGVKLVDANIVDFVEEREKPRNEAIREPFDVVMSVMTLLHVPYPGWKLLRDVVYNEMLAEDGVALIQSPNVYNDTNIDDLQTFLQERGYDFEVFKPWFVGENFRDAVSFRKTSPVLDVPVWTRGYEPEQDA